MPLLALDALCTRAPPRGRCRRRRPRGLVALRVVLVCVKGEGGGTRPQQRVTAGNGAAAADEGPRGTQHDGGVSGESCDAPCRMARCMRVAGDAAGASARARLTAGDERRRHRRLRQRVTAGDGAAAAEGASLPVGHEGPRGTQRPAMHLAGWHDAACACGWGDAAVSARGRFCDALARVVGCMNARVVVGEEPRA